MVCMYVFKPYVIKILDAISHFAVTLERDCDLNFLFFFLLWNIFLYLLSISLVVLCVAFAFKHGLLNSSLAY